MQQRYLFAFGLAALCLLASCQSQQAGSDRIETDSGLSQLNLDQATADLDYFFQTVEKVHPNHLANLSKKDYQLLKDRSRTTLARACEDTGYVSKRVLALTVAEAAAALGDGHTFGRLTVDLVDPCDTTPCMPPFRLGWQTGQIVISDACEELQYLKGVPLLGINGRPLKKALAPMVAKCSGERWESRMDTFLQDQGLYWALIRPVEGKEMALTLPGRGGESVTLPVELISWSRYGTHVPTNPPRSPFGVYQLHHNGWTCYWQYNSCNPTPEAMKLMETVFQVARDRGARNLILDLRFNSGGSDKATRAVIDHLTSKPYRLYSRIGGRVSDDLLRTEPKWYLRLLRGRYVSAPVQAQAPGEVKNRFEGAVYVLTSPNTFSAAADLAAVLKDYGMATLIGEETGGVRQSFGEAYGHRLPNSGVEFSVSGKQFFAPVPRPDDARRGTVPDIMLTEELLSPFADDTDPALAYTLDLIQKRDPQPPQ
jgi:hypothetical protein